MHLVLILHQDAGEAPPTEQVQSTGLGFGAQDAQEDWILRATSCHDTVTSPLAGIQFTTPQHQLVTRLAEVQVMLGRVGHGVGGSTCPQSGGRNG